MGLLTPDVRAMFAFSFHLNVRKSPRQTVFSFFGSDALCTIRNGNGNPNRQVKRRTSR